MLYIYTDGSVSRPKDGKSPGGWAYYYVHNGVHYRGSGCFRDTTNNQMEMIAVIKALQSLLKNEFNNEPICVVSDSQYVIYGVSQWLPNWKVNRWKDGRGRPLKNKNLWKQIDFLASHFNQSRWKWVRGHNGHRENEIVDKLAWSASRRAAGLVDTALVVDCD